MNSRWCLPLFSVALLVGLSLLFTQLTLAHCDTMDGPVVSAARKALETGNVNYVLIWVGAKDEAVIKSAFEKTLAVRRLSEEAKNLADMYFFETLVRLHRAGEGVAYTGLKPAGTPVDPGIAAADKALQGGGSDQLAKDLSEKLSEGIRKQLEEVVAAKAFDPDDVASGRRYVAAYVRFIHYIERLEGTISEPAKGHLHEAGESEID